MRFELIHHGQVDSTSERAFAAIAAGTARHGDVHIATEQTKGRGRFGRAWHSPPGEGLYMSVVLLPPPPAWDAPALTITAGLAMFDAAAALGVTQARLKWPNDLMCDGCKLAGALIETRGLDPAHPHYVVGIGLNVGQAGFPPELDRRPTSLALLGVSTTVEAALHQVLRAFSRRVEQMSSAPARLAADYARASHLDGARVRVRFGESDVAGDVVGLSLHEGLRLRTAAGAEQWFSLAVIRQIEPVRQTAE